MYYANYFNGPTSLDLTAGIKLPEAYSKTIGEGRKILYLLKVGLPITTSRESLPNQWWLSLNADSPLTFEPSSSVYSFS